MALPQRVGGCPAVAPSRGTPLALFGGQRNGDQPRNHRGPCPGAPGRHGSGRGSGGPDRSLQAFPQARDRAPAHAPSLRPGRGRDRHRPQLSDRPRGHPGLPGGRGRRRPRGPAGARAVRGRGPRRLRARRARPVLRRRPPLPARRAPLGRASRTSFSGPSCSCGTSASRSATASARRASASRWPGRTSTREPPSPRRVSSPATPPSSRTLLKALESGLLRDKRATEQFLQSMRVELSERYAKVGGAVCIQEPNVKEGVGGLRDLHAVLWVGHARFGSRGLAGLHAEGWVSDARLRGRAAGLRRPVPGPQRGPLHHRPQDRPPDPGRAARPRPEPRLQAEGRPARVRDLHAGLLPPRFGDPPLLRSLHGPPPEPGASAPLPGPAPGPPGAARLRGARGRAPCARARGGDEGRARCRSSRPSPPPRPKGSTRATS